MRQRLTYASLAATFAAFALLTRMGLPLPDVVSVYGGDFLWGVMLYFLICAVLPCGIGMKNLVSALLISYTVESFQLYQADWILLVRANKWGGLLLGHGFLWSDILLYTLGNITGFCLSLFVPGKPPQTRLESW